MPEAEVTVRSARVNDTATIALFNIQLARETEELRLDPVTVEHGVHAVFEDDRRGRYFVAEFNGQVVGCLMITHEWSDWRNGDMWWIQSVYVAADHRRRGVFRMLYAHVEKSARDAGAVAMRLYVDHDNARARATYLSLGMELQHYQIFHKALPA